MSTASPAPPPGERGGRPGGAGRLRGSCATGLNLSRAPWVRGRDRRTSSSNERRGDGSGDVYPPAPGNQRARVGERERPASRLRTAPPLPKASPTAITSS